MNIRPIGFAQDRTSARSAFIRAKKLVLQYGARLRRIARHIGDIVNGFDQTTLQGQLFTQIALRRYADTIHDWAEATAERMVTEVAQNDRQAWRKVSAEMGRALTLEIDEAPTGAVMRQLKAEQVTLIKSLPLEAAQRVHQIATEGISKGMRAPELAAEILKTGEVTRSRATLIARTEIGRTATTLTQARAQHIGSTHFIWRTARDSDVRPSHRRLEGEAFRWDDPPECDPGYHALPGAIFNCRCYPEVIIPD